MKNAFLLSLLSLVLLGFIASCGGGATSTEASASTSEVKEEAVSSTIEVLLTGNDQMKYNKDLIEVTEGQNVKLTFKHVGELPKEAMGHNFVLLTPGTDVDEFAQSAITHQDTDYLPPSGMDNIIAHTTMLGGGESDEIEFAAPAPGTYDFICTFPGHYGVMRGKFVVKPKVG